MLTVNFTCALALPTRESIRKMSDREAIRAIMAQQNPENNQQQDEDSTNKIVEMFQKQMLCNGTPLSFFDLCNKELNDAAFDFRMEMIKKHKEEMKAKADEKKKKK